MLILVGVKFNLKGCVPLFMREAADKPWLWDTWTFLEILINLWGKTFEEHIDIIAQRVR